MRAEFDADGVLNIIPENNAESMAIKYFTDNEGEIAYHPTQFDTDGNPTMNIKLPAGWSQHGEYKDGE